MSIATALLSLLIGLSLGLLGGGGSILSVPILIFSAGLPDKVAIATSLLVVGVTSAVATSSSARAGAVDWRTSLVFAAASMAGAFAGGRLAAYVPGRVLLVGFALTMAVAAVAMWQGRREATARPPSSATRILALGAGVGLLTGLLGAGGGFLIVPALALWAGLPMHRAVGSSLFIIALNSLAGLAGYLGHVDVDLRVGVGVTALAVVGSLVGTALRGRVPELALRRSFAVLVAAVAGFLLASRLG